MYRKLPWTNPMELDKARIERYQRQLREDETQSQSHGAPKNSKTAGRVAMLDDLYLPILLTTTKSAFIACSSDGSASAKGWADGADWKALLKTLTFDNKDLGGSFIRYLMRDYNLRWNGCTINSENSMQVYTRRLRGLYKKYTAEPWDDNLRDHLRQYAKILITPKWKLRREPKAKPTMGPDFFIYHIHFLWVHDTSHFHIGLDRLDDATVRHFAMYTGCQKHELVYAKPPYLDKILKTTAEDTDAYTDVENDTDECVRRRPKECWLRVLCWEDIDFWILRDPERNGGRARLAMQVLHKGENKKIVPTWFTFIGEDMPALCPVSHVLAKALAEGEIDAPGYQTTAEPFFSTKLNQPSIQIKWKREWLHGPVFRRTLDDLGIKSNEPLTAGTFDSHSIRLGVAMGLLAHLTEYAYRRGFANCVDENYRQSVRDQGLRHRPNSTIYQEAYHNANCHAIVQDVFLGRGTATLYLAISNHIGLRRDENAPKVVSDELMCDIGPSSDVRRLEEEVKKMKADLEEKYGRISSAPKEDQSRYARKREELRVARQKHRRKVFKMIYKDHFDARDEEEP
ncbi:uncharacterized protein NECHADRAFT_76100 [Fusarium vanettenii 77-13-4]|uniref:Uncharacterized protein n=1 Tax=Fusarium vanettenii (strain ATCC MYA-4622 / CBS 123669 / FGSC 9596 / NRRL 45880 / 77-13-4) TaxID=660122 RepID=C7Z6H3_FUSV7|nr:uncharacterized protein NECHADRAFT_76100 [Fusarium vanettenii 77-13-4]EEU40131.1 hypothetical protein NECHADRAFT_76100 [Fusarium vanettenii 77-13-4]